jgi:hypothetical protein
LSCSIPPDPAQFRLVDKYPAAVGRFLLVTALTVPAIALLISLHSLKSSWDDGAITAAFARTFADTGIFALTPLSPKVEGFSSLSWFFLLSLCHAFASSPVTYLIWMKVLAAVFFLLSVVVLIPLSRRFIENKDLAYFAVWLLAFSITPFYETFNGMEMNLALFLILLLVYILTSRLNIAVRFLSAWIVVSLLLVTRFEAPVALVALMAGCILARKCKAACPGFSFLLALFVACCGSFLAIERWRRHTFGLWMPNTVYAKLWWPYQPLDRSWYGLVVNRSSATLEIAIVLLAPLVVTFVVMARNRFVVQNLLADPTHPVVAVLAIGAIMFGFVFGKNLGHRGRMTETFLPFAIILIVGALLKFSHNQLELRTAVVLVAILQLCVWFVIVHRLAVRGDGVPISTLETEGLSADYVRRVLNKDSLTIMIPDVGGAALCCSHLRILDIALITNPELSQHGYADFYSYFLRSNPDLVEAHQGWAIASNIYNTGLLAGYSLIQVGDNRLFLRNDLYRQLPNGKLGTVETLPYCLGSSREDMEYSRRKVVCLDLGEPR